MPLLTTIWNSLLTKKTQAPALIDLASDTVMTRRDLQKATNSLLAIIPENVRGHSVAFSLPNSSEWLALFLALQHRRAIALPLDASLSPEAAHSIARKTHASFLWSKNTLIPLDKKTLSSASSCALQKLTSGSTGEPRIINCKASHLIADGQQVIASMKILPRDINLGLIPFGHSYGIGNLIMPLLLQGTCIAFASGFVPSQMAGWIRKHRITVYPSVPALLRILADTPSLKTLKPLRLVISAGAVLDQEIARRFHRKFDLKIHNFYGSSETGGIAYDRNGSATLEGRAVGRPMEGVRIDLKKGQIRVQSKAVAMPGGKHLLADLGEWNRRGELKITGRVGRVANIGGKKVVPGEIESALKNIIGSNNVWVDVEQHKGRDYLIAAVESKLDEKTIREHLSKALPPWKQPLSLKVWTTFPRTERGKPDTTQMRNLLRIP